MIVQGCWMKDDPLLQLPHVEPYHLNLFYNLPTQSTAFPDIVQSYSGKLDLLRKNLSSQFKENQIQQINKALLHVPLLKVTHSVTGTPLLAKSHIPQETPGGGSWIPVHADKEYSLEVKMSILRSGKARQERGKQGGRKALAPRFNKPVDETWFVVLGEIETGELIALKRCGPFRGNTLSVPLAFYTPEVPGRHVYTLFVISQTYFGLDQQYPIYLEVLESEIVYQMDADLADESFEEDFDKAAGLPCEQPPIQNNDVESLPRRSDSPPEYVASNDAPPGFASQKHPSENPPPGFGHPPGMPRKPFQKEKKSKNQGRTHNAPEDCDDNSDKWS